MTYAEGLEDVVLGGIAITTIFLVFIAVYAVLIVANWKIYEKAGEKGWKSLIPFYSQYILARISFGNGWLFLLFLIPVVNSIYGIVQALYLCRAFGQDRVGFIILMILFPYIMTLVLAFGGYSYIGPRGERSGGQSGGYRETWDGYDSYRREDGYRDDRYGRPEDDPYRRDDYDRYQ